MHILGLRRSGERAYEEINEGNPLPVSLDGRPLTAGGQTLWVAAGFQRPNNTTAYTPNNAVSGSTVAPVLCGFVGCARLPGGSGYITGVRLETDQTTNAARYRLWLYNARVAAVADGAAVTVLWANRASRLGFIQTPAAQTDGADIAFAQDATIRLPFVCDTGQMLWGLLETLDGFTPAALQSYYLALAVEQN